jgi:hypothetical protein
MAGNPASPKKPSGDKPNTSSTGKKKATPKEKGGGKKQGRHK